MPYNQGGRNASRGRSNRNRAPLGHSGRQVVEALDESSPTIKAFLSIKEELDDNHNCYERIVKLSRDATIESKRIIFLLHSLDRENKREAVLNEAQERITKLNETVFRKIAEELQGRDAYDYIRAYTAGLQEYVEAVTFLSYLKDKALLHWTLIQSNLVFDCKDGNSKIEEEVSKEVSQASKQDDVSEASKQDVVPEASKQDDVSEASKQDEVCQVSKLDEGNSQAVVPVTLKALLTPVDYILGVSDLTGELMRLCINSLGMGKTDDCFKVCSFARRLSIEFSKIGHVPSREYNHKMHTFQQSLQKMETTCYNIVVRGEEMPKSLLVASLQEKQPDEGYCD